MKPKMFSKALLLLAAAVAVFPSVVRADETAKPFKVAAFYTGKEDQAHISFMKEANGWFPAMAKEHGFTYETTNDWKKLNAGYLADCKVVVFLDTRPEGAEQRQAFQEYMEKGGSWMGFHFAAFALKDSAVKPDWSWYHDDFLGSGEYGSNTWRPTSAVLKVEAPDHPALKGLPATFKSAPNEWYRWKKNLRENPDITVLLSIDPSSFPLGTGPKPHEIWHDGDYPVTWTNRKYRMVYFNMGHNDIDYEGKTNKELSFTFKNEVQNQLVVNSLHWLAADEKEPRSTVAPVTIHANQVVYDRKAPKVAVVEAAEPFADGVRFRIVGEKGKVFEGPLGGEEKCDDWFAGRSFYRVDFSGLAEEGRFRIEIEDKGKTWSSSDFEVGDQALAKLAIPAVTGFFKHQRADSKEELEADKQLLLHGSDKRVDLRGGWCDASGDVSKYFSHLAYTHYMCPQQSPLVVWSMANTLETAGPLLEKLGAKEALKDEALYGAEYLLRSLSPEGYFYMTVFSYFNKDASARRVVGLLADSKTTNDYQCAFRDGGGMGIAALARVSKWKKDAGYLEAAERAFAHLQANNLKYADDGKENIIDDHCALMAATELWIATDKPEYRDAARDRASKLIKRQSPEGYFIADGGKRPYWHASDAGLPVLALARYLDKEAEDASRERALASIRGFLDYQLRVTGKATNPFGYARQSFLFRNEVKDGFFIPHENESGWWWQGENARLTSLASAAIVGGRLVYPDKAAPYGVKPELGRFAADQVAWILGGNTYDVCFMYHYGKTNVPYMKSMFGHGSGRGGISNGVTGKNADGSGIDFHFHANGNEWRWTEQWIPHSAWFLQAVTAMSN